MKRWSIVVLTLGVLFVPVIVRQLFPFESRQLERVALADTRYAEVMFQNRTQNLALGGLLFVPEVYVVRVIRTSGGLI